jgi:site-specific DNA recombinase
MLIPVVEERIEDHYESHQLDPTLRDQIEIMLRDELSSMQRRAESENRDLTIQKDRLTNERTRLLQAHYAGAVPLELLKAEQDRIARRLAAIEASLTATNVEFDKIEACLQKALDYATHSYEAYMRATPQERRLMNQAFFTRITVHDDDVQVELAEPFQTLFSEQLADMAQRSVGPSRKSCNEQPASQPSLTTVLGSQNANKPAHLGAGLKDTLLVELRGLEPLTPTLPVWCATSCAIAP